MTAYIKLSTNEYPRHIGDIELDPAGAVDYAAVEWVDPPEINAETQRAQEGPPVLSDNIWRMTWVVRDATPAELEYVAKRQSATAASGSPPNVIG